MRLSASPRRPWRVAWASLRRRESVSMPSPRALGIDFIASTVEKKWSRPVPFPTGNRGENRSEVVGLEPDRGGGL